MREVSILIYDKASNKIAFTRKYSWETKTTRDAGFEMSLDY